MFDLRKFSEFYFDSTQISDSLAISILRINIGRMEQNNANKLYDQLIADSKTFLVALEKSVSLVDTTITTRIAKTKSLKQITELLNKEVRKLDGLLRNVFEKGSPQYSEFFPKGMAEYNHTTKINLETLLLRLVEKTAKFKDALGEKSQTTFQSLYTDYKTALMEQEEQKGQLGNQKTASSTARSDVNLQLQKNLITILYNNIGVSDCLSNYFDLNLIPKSRTYSKTVINPEETTKPEEKPIN